MRESVAGAITAWPCPSTSRRYAWPFGRKDHYPECRFGEGRPRLQGARAALDIESGVHVARDVPEVRQAAMSRSEGLVSPFRRPGAVRCGGPEWSCRVLA